MRREGLCSSQLSKWRRPRQAGQRTGRRPKKRGRKVDARAQEVARFERENAGLQAQLGRVELIIEAQEKAARVAQPADHGSARADGMQRVEGLAKPVDMEIACQALGMPAQPPVCGAPTAPGESPPADFAAAGAALGGGCPGAANLEP